jgi:hypothetical protein
MLGEGQMDLAKLEQISAVVTAVMTTVGALVAVFALLIASRQIYAARRLNAEDAYLEFHKTCLAHPPYAEPDYQFIFSSRDRLVGYKWFIFGMLMAVERILLLIPRDPTWRKAVLDDMERHADYLCSRDFADSVPNFSPDMQKLLREMVGGGERTWDFATPPSPAEPPRMPVKLGEPGMRQPS